jgi:N-methylhydantoinase B
MNNTMVGGLDLGAHNSFSYYETVGGGAGGGPTKPGASGVQVHMTNTRNTPIESLETAYPLRVVEYSIRRGSGGAGQHPGGDGVVRRIKFLTDVRVTVISERRESAPWGLNGGSPGLPGETTVEVPAGEFELPAKTSVDIAPGSVLAIRTPGGGGWGVA